MRKRLSIRNQSLAKIVESANLSRGCVPSTSALRDAVASLQSQIAAHQAELAAIRASDEFNQAEELASDLLTAYEEIRRLEECTAEAAEYREHVASDIAIARARLSDEEQQRELPGLREETEAMRREIAEIHERRLAALVAREDDASIRSRIETLEGTLSAERMSSSRAVEAERESSVELLGIARAAAERLRAAMARAATHE